MSLAEPRPGFGPYALITPARNEAEHLRCTLASVLAQSVPPVRWVVVDDGSSDGTGELLQAAAGQHGFIRVVRLEDRGFREPGPGVVRAFRRGLRELADVPFEFVGKLDGDVEVPCGYYQRLLAAFAADPRLGIASGACLAPRGSGFRLEPNAPFHTRGPCKMYRRVCLEEIGGLVPTLGWDGLDGYTARMRGWRTRTLIELKVIHFRPTHRAEGKLRGAVRSGRGAYFQHYLLSYLLARAVRNLFRPPAFLGSLGMVFGFLVAHLSREDRVGDPGLIRFIQQEQRRRLRRLGRRG